MANETSSTLDVPATAHRERHPMIFTALETLKPGEAVRLTNDRDPKSLYYQLLAERPGIFDWQAEQEGPKTWVIRITRRTNVSY